jgi:hypothetical protein
MYPRQPVSLCAAVTMPVMYERCAGLDVHQNWRRNQTIVQIAPIPTAQRDLRHKAQRVKSPGIQPASVDGHYEQDCARLFQ